MTKAPAPAVLRALANGKRLAILNWLKNPRAHFREQIYGDLVSDGVCGLFLAEKLGVTQSTLSEHMKVLVQHRLVRTRKIRQWTFYKREEARIDELKKALAKNL